MVNVFNVNGDFSVENNTISLTGAANDTFIFNISGADGLNLSGVTMILTGGLVASDIVFNVSNTSANISIFSSTVDGTFYTSSDDPINDNGQINISASLNESVDRDRGWSLGAVVTLTFPTASSTQSLCRKCTYRRSTRNAHDHDRRTRRLLLVARSLFRSFETKAFVRQINAGGLGSATL